MSLAFRLREMLRFRDISRPVVFHPLAACYWTNLAMGPSTNRRVEMEVRTKQESSAEDLVRVCITMLITWSHCEYHQHKANETTGNHDGHLHHTVLLVIQNNKRRHETAQRSHNAAVVSLMLSVLAIAILHRGSSSRQT